MTVTFTVSRSAVRLAPQPYPVEACQEWMRQPQRPDPWGHCDHRATWRVTGTTPGGDIDGRSYHWTRFLCGPHYDKRFASLVANPHLEDVTAAPIPVPGFRWATLLMIRDWTDVHAPMAVSERLTAAEASMASQGLFGELYAAKALRRWMDDTPCTERDAIDAAWTAVHDVIAAQHHIRLTSATG
ncbi:hypothetical protein [Actinomadura hibisca]|uniref:hypothetical protein n=1 Tax=Actinomadura hibisca TaxID=68565 RepID=UPI00083576E1|nr:hypothetical protein [Actinomadura hibisca]